MIAYSLGIAVTSTDAGATAFAITSTEEETKTVRKIEYTDITTHPLLLSVWLEREQIVEDVPLEEVADLMPVRTIELNVEIPVGQTLTCKVKPQTAASQGVMDGLVYYEIAK